MATQETLDLLTDEYWIVGWPGYTLHSNKFPYLVYRLASGVYAPVKIPPKYQDPLSWLEWAREQTEKYRRPTCLVLSPKHCFYVHSVTKIEESKIPAMGGSVVNFEKWVRKEIAEFSLEIGGATDTSRPTVTIFATNNPKSEMPSVMTNNERIRVEGLEKTMAAN